MQDGTVIATPPSIALLSSELQTEVALPGEAEELAGPPPVPESAERMVSAPVAQQERIATIDVVRGVALMGILVMNISSFSGPFEMYNNPLSVGTHRTAN